MTYEHDVEEWLERIFAHEKGYSSIRTDPGNWTGGRVGRGKLLGTKYGIAANSYPTLDIKNLSIDEAAEIYKQDYLKPIRADKLSSATAFQLFDFAINSGVSRAIKTLQKSIGVTVDGAFGPKTLRRVKNFNDVDLAITLLAERLDFMTRLRSWSDFGKGWSRRIAKNMSYVAIDASG